MPSKDVNSLVPGWPALARRIANKPAFLAFPAFTDLNVKSLLYYKAELISLRKKLHEEEYNDRFNGEGPQTSFAENLDFLIGCGRLRKEKPKQWELIEEIRTILDKYNTALIQFSQVSAFPDADSCNVKCLKNCAKTCNDGSGLTGSGSQIWGGLGKDTEKEKPSWQLFLRLFVGLFKSQEEKRATVNQEFQEHLIVPRQESKPDGLTLWVVHSFIPLFHYVWGKCGRPTWGNLWRQLQGRLCSCRLPKCYQGTTEKRGSIASSTGTPGSDGSNVPDVEEKNLTSYSASWILRVTSILTTIVACLLPVIAIVILSRVHTMGMILGLIALFNTVFAFGLVLISSTSSRVDIFTATAAFSAVMVVFVQNKISQQ